MLNINLYEITTNHQETQLRYADTYRLSQAIDEHNKQKFDWRDLLKPFNRSTR